MTEDSFLSGYLHWVCGKSICSSPPCRISTTGGCFLNILLIIAKYRLFNAFLFSCSVLTFQFRLYIYIYLAVSIVPGAYTHTLVLDICKRHRLPREPHNNTPHAVTIVESPGKNTYYNRLRSWAALATHRRLFIMFNSLHYIMYTFTPRKKYSNHPTTFPTFRQIPTVFSLHFVDAIRRSSKCHLRTRDLDFCPKPVEKTD